MVGYFKLGRRKIGVLTLAVALLFMVGWVRSTLYSDEIHVRIGGLIHSLNSFDTQLRWQVWRSDNPSFDYQAIIGESVMRAERDLHMRRILYKLYENAIIEQRIHYWVLALPLTLLSVWLMLSKPRQPRTIPPAAGNLR